MRKAYKFRLYPTKAQQERIQFTLERCRLLYNRLLDERRLASDTDKTTLNYYDQANTFNERKSHIPALKQVHSQVLQDGKTSRQSISGILSSSEDGTPAIHASSP